MTHTTSDGRSFQTDKGGHLTNYKAPGVEAHFNAGGKADFVHHEEPGGRVTEIHVSPGGVRRVETVDHDGARTVSYGPGRGYKERPLLRRPGYMQRTYFVGGRSYVRIYHVNRFGYPVYVHPYFYHPAFYVWMGNPWPVQVSYAWGTGPWFGVYGGYFAPAPGYVGPDAWMADYMISQNLQAAYAMQQEASQAPYAYGPPPAPIPANVRADYTTEVQQQIQSDQQQAGGTPDSGMGALAPNFTLFAATTATKADINGQQCDITRGDFIRRLDPAPDSNGEVHASVVGVAQTGDGHCQVGQTVQVKVADLQDWYNSFVESSESAMEALATNQGKNGFPAAPDTTQVASMDGQGTADDPHALGQALQDQQAGANQIQTQVQQDTGQGAF